MSMRPGHVGNLVAEFWIQECLHKTYASTNVGAKSPDIAAEEAEKAIEKERQPACGKCLDNEAAPMLLKSVHLLVGASGVKGAHFDLRLLTQLYRDLLS